MEINDTMATVRITNNIRYHVRNKFEALYRERIERKKKELENLGIGNMCYSHCIPAKYRELARQLNADNDGTWLPETTNITIEMTYLRNDANRTEATVAFTVPLEPPAPLPQRMRTLGAKFKLLESMALYEYVKNICLEIDAMREERDKLIDQIVNGVLAKCSTLHQVLELWPTVMDFLPDEIKRKHTAKTKKRQSIVEGLSIDDDVKISLMKARMLATEGQRAPI